MLNLGEVTSERHASPLEGQRHGQVLSEAGDGEQDPGREELVLRDGYPRGGAGEKSSIHVKSSFGWGL